MGYEIELQNDNNYPLDDAVLIRAAETTLRERAVSQGCGLTIAIVEDDAIQALNAQFRGIDTPTDVLSFPAGDIPSELTYLGDLVIAFPYAASQAERFGHDLTDNLCLLVVHGTLHLLGYDHDTEENRDAMWQVQQSVLSVLNISPEIVPE